MGDIRNSGQAANGNRTETLSFCSYDLGQCCPHHYPHRRDFEDITGDPLGAPMTISQVAKLLGCSIWTRNLLHANKAIDKLQAGNVWVNSLHYGYDELPFGGVKSSGVGREHGPEALDYYLEPKGVVVVNV